MLAQIWYMPMPTLSVYTGIHALYDVAQVVNNMAVALWIELMCKRKII